MLLIYLCLLFYGLGWSALSWPMPVTFCPSSVSYHA